MTEHPRRYICGAVISDAPAWMLRRLFPLSEVERRLDDGGIFDPLRAEILDAWQAVSRAAEVFETSARESVSMRPAEATAPLNCELTTEQVADTMHLTESRVRQLARQGDLPGRQIAGRWLFGRADVERYQKGQHDREP